MMMTSQDEATLACLETPEKCFSGREYFWLFFLASFGIQHEAAGSRMMLGDCARRSL